MVDHFQEEILRLLAVEPQTDTIRRQEDYVRAQLDALRGEGMATMKQYEENLIISVMLGICNRSCVIT